MKYHFLFLLSCMLLFSCEHSKKKLITEKIKEKDTLIYTVSAKILDNTYRADYRSNMILYVITKNDTLITQKEEGLSPVPLKFEDYNKDGMLDIRYGYNSNYFFETIMLFNRKTKQFRKIENIDNPEYAYSKKIKNTDLYFSYSPNGCGKNNWESYLFSIEDYKVVPKGHIEYKQCADDEKGMYVFRIKNDEKILIEKVGLKEADNKELENLWINYLKKIASP
ncbi:MAG: hypothetical protein ABI576_00540 [Flavobacterium sp.]